MRKITPITVIENASGTYECWCEKEFCNDYYRFHARQVSVKAYGQHYHINNGLTEFKLHVQTKAPSYSDIQPSIEIKTIQLSSLNGVYSGKITLYKTYYEQFKEEVKRKAITILL